MVSLPHHVAALAVAARRAVNAAGARSAWQATQPDGRALARSLGVQFLLGAFVILIAVMLPSPDESDEPVLLATGALALAIGLALRFAPRSGRRCTDLGMLVLVAMISVVVLIARPMGLAPLFYLWPLLLTVNYAQSAQVVLMTALTIGAFGAALVLGATTDDAPAAFVEFSLVTAGVVFWMRRLRVRNAELYRELQRQATVDGLTGALNRGAFEEAFAAVLAAGAGAPPALLMLDIDHFKAVNDLHGHPAGDTALRHLCAVVDDVLRPGDAFGRVGGEEFAVLLPATSVDDATGLAERMRAVIAAPSTASVPFTVSIGVAGDGDPDPWLAADRALYAAKHSGRDRVVRADAAESASAIRRRAVPPAAVAKPAATTLRRSPLTLLTRDQGGLVMPRRDG